MSSATTIKAAPGDSTWALPRPGPAPPSAPTAPEAAKRPHVWRGGAGPPGGGVTISIAGDNQPGQGEQALNREESPRDRPLKPGDVGHGAGKCHGGALRGYFEVRRQSPLGEGRGQCRDSARWSPPRRSRRHPEGGFGGRALRGGAGQGRAGRGWRRRAPLPSQRRRPHVAATATPQPRRWGQERDWGRERERGCPGWQRPFRVPRGDTAHTSPCPLASPQAQGAAPQGGHCLSPLPCPSAGSAI